MMSKWRKNIVLPFLFGFAIPVITVFCCCNGAVAAERISTDHHHSEAEVGHHANPIDSNGSACHHPNKSSHDHSECNHPQLIANLFNNSVQFFAAQISSLQKNFGDHFKELIFFQGSIKPESSPPFLNTGPPVFDSSNTPLYLQISVLRI